MGLFDSLGDWTSLLNTGVNAVSAYNAYGAQQDASALANKTFDTIAGSTAKQDEIAQELFDRYKQTYWPMEDKQVALQNDWMDRYTPEIQQQAWDNYEGELALQPQYQQVEQGLLDQASISAQDWGDQYAEKAHADVQSSFDANRQSTQRALGRLGIDPTSGRSLNALNSGMDVAQSLADVSGQNAAMTQGYDTSWNRGAGALGFKMGNTIPQQTTAASGSGLASTALSGMGSANASNNSLLNSALSSAGAGSKAFGASTSALLGTGSGSVQAGLSGAQNILSGYA